MKRFYSTITTAALALAVSVVGMAKVQPVAQNVSTPLTVEKQLKAAKSISTVQTSNTFKGIKQADVLDTKGMRKAAKAAPSTIVGKTYVATFNDDEDDYTSSFSVEAGSSADEVVFKGLAAGLDVKGTYDAQTGQINIPVNVSLGNNGYGDVTLYSLEGEYYSQTEPITATVDDNKIVFDNGVYSTFTFQGTEYYDALMLDIVAYEPNGKVSYSTANKSVTAPIYVRKNTGESIQFYGLQVALLSAGFRDDFNEAVSYEYELTLSEPTSEATGEFQAISNYGSYGDFYFGLIIDGYIDDPVFDVAVESNTSTLTAQDNAQGFMGYENGQSYSGMYVNDLKIEINMDVFNAPVSDDVPDPDEGWTTVGNASFEDAWVLPGIGVIAPTDPAYIYDVPLQQNDANPYLYRLVDPYHQPGFAGLDYNTSTKVGYIMIDVTDPDRVVINGYKVDAGFANPSAGISKFYCYNTLGMYLAEGYTLEEVAQYLGDEMPLTTYKNGVVTLSYYNDPMYGIEYDANFGIPAAPEGGYQWQDEFDQPVAMTGSITFPTSGVNDVIGDNSANGPVRYYNLQGVEVANPTAGSLYIKVQGKNATKVLVK